MIIVEFMETCVTLAIYNKNKSPNILKVKKIEIPSLNIGEESLNLVSDKLKQYLLKNSIRSKKAYVNIKTSKSIMKLVELPKMSEKYLSNTAKSSYQAYFPIDIEKFRVDYRVVHSTETFTKVLFAAIPSEISSASLKVMQKAGIKPIFMDLYQECICREVANHCKESVAVIINFQNAINIILMKHGFITFIRTMPLKDYHTNNYAFQRFMDSMCVRLDIAFIIGKLKWVEGYFLMNNTRVTLCDEFWSLRGLIE